jgi:hypothetical protein
MRTPEADDWIRLKVLSTLKSEGNEESRESREGNNVNLNGRYKTRTCDLYDVNVAL